MKTNERIDALDDKVLSAVIRQAILFQYASDKCAAIRSRMAAVADELRMAATRPSDAELLRLANNLDDFAEAGERS